MSKCTAMLTVTLALLLGALQPARADDLTGPPVRGQVNILVLGDSYAAGAGAGDYTPSDGPYFRSPNNWASQYADWLIKQRVSATVINRARSGATSTAVIDEQIEEIRQQNQQGNMEVDPSRIDLVALSAGGNDGRFNDAVTHCFFVGLQDVAQCRDAIDSFRQLLTPGEDSLRTRMRALFTAIDDLLSNDRAEIVLMGYPQLVVAEAEGYTLQECLRPGPVFCAESRPYQPVREMRELGEQLNTSLAEIVAEWNAESTRRVHFVDSIVSDFEGHEADPGFITRNPARWINEFFETEGDVTPQGELISKGSQDRQAWYHPNKAGQRKMADALVLKLGIPTAMRPLDPGKQTFAWLQGPYSGIVGQPLELSAAASYADGRTPVRFEWDFDGDGQFDQETTTPTVSHTWDGEYTGDIRVRVSGPGGEAAEAAAYTTITQDGDTIPAAQDNCPDVANYTQEDRDDDGIGDVCDPRPGSPS